MATAAFCDDNWLGEGLAAGSVPTQHNYNDLIFLPGMRSCTARSSGTPHQLAYGDGGVCRRPGDASELYGKMTILRETATSANGSCPSGRTTSAWPASRSSTTSGRAATSPGADLDSLRSRAADGWDDYVQFTGYWEPSDRLKVIGRAPEKMVCSLYHRPAAPPPPVVVANSAATIPLRHFHLHTADRCRRPESRGKTKRLAHSTPMNNTDEDVTLTLRPVEAFG